MPHKISPNLYRSINFEHLSRKGTLDMQVDEPSQAPVVLDAGAGEVTGVAWCPTDQGHITTCHDQAAISVWMLDRSRVKEPPARPPQVRHFIPAVHPDTVLRLYLMYSSAGKMWEEKL